VTRGDDWGGMPEESRDGPMGLRDGKGIELDDLGILWRFLIPTIPNYK
jgi:hypothetical protein